MVDKQKTWTALILEWEKSGLSQKEFCRLKKLSYPAFHYWSKKLNTKTGQFVEIKVHKAIENNHPIIIVLPNNISIRMHQIPEFNMIENLVRSLKDLTC